MLLTMENIKYRPRKKAFIGAVIGAAASIAGGIIGARKRKKAARREAERQKALKRNEEVIKSTEALNAGLQGQEEIQDNFMEQYMKYGGSVRNPKYKDRKKKAIGGIGEIIGGVIGGASTIVGAATNNPEIATAGNAVGQAVGTGLANHNAKRIAEQRKDNLTKPIPINGINADLDTTLPTTLQPIKKYGGRSMTLVAGSKGVKVKPRRV